MRTDWPTPADAIARYRAQGGRPDSYLGRGTPGSELLATGDAGAYAEWLGAAPQASPDPVRPNRPGRGELRGLVLRGGRGGSGLSAGNPWGLPPVTDLGQVIRQLWAPVADHAPAFVDRLEASVFAVAEVRSGDRDYLAYLMVTWVSRDVPDTAVASIEELMDASKLSVGEAWGMAPLPEPGPVWGVAMPAALRAFAAVHGSLTVFSDETYLDFEHTESYRDFLRSGPDPDEWAGPEGKLVVFARHHDSWYVLDLETRDAAGDPTVVHHDPQDGLVLTMRKPLGRFLAKDLRDLLDIDA